MIIQALFSQFHRNIAGEKILRYVRDTFQLYGETSIVLSYITLFCWVAMQVYSTSLEPQPPRHERALASLLLFAIPIQR